MAIRSRVRSPACQLNLSQNLTVSAQLFNERKMKLLLLSPISRRWNSLSYKSTIVRVSLSLKRIINKYIHRKLTELKWLILWTDNWRHIIKLSRKLQKNWIILFSVCLNGLTREIYNGRKVLQIKRVFCFIKLNK